MMKSKTKKGILSVVLVIALLLSTLIMPMKTKAAGWPDVAKELTLGSTITGSIKSGDYTGITEDKSYNSSYYWNVYRFTMPKTGLLNIHLESGNERFMNYESGYGGSSYSGFAIFSAINPDTLIWRSRQGENKISSSYSAAREIYYGSTDISLDAGEYYFIVRYSKTYDDPYYLTLSYKEPVYNVTSLTLDKTKMNLTIGDSQTIKASIVPDNATVKDILWKSSAPTVATVENGVVKTVSAGTASIIASSLDGTASAVCEITVAPPLTDYEYKVLDDGTAEITRYIGTTEELIIPSELEGKVVSAISSRAFQNSEYLKTLEIPGSVKTIGSYAFQNCSSLTSLEIPESVTEIGAYAFQNCNSLTDLTIPESVAEIADGVFQNCYGLTSIQLSNETEEIGSYAFQNCSGLKEMNLPENLHIIKTAAFSACRSLERVTLPEHLQTIEDRAFYGCSNLAEIEIPKTVEIIGESAFKQCSDNFMMKVVPGSYGASYAESFGISYVYTEEAGGTEEPAVTGKPIVTAEPIVTQKPVASIAPVVSEKPQQPDQRNTPTKTSDLKKLKLSSVKYNRNSKKITGKVSVSKATVKIKIGKEPYKKVAVKGKKFTFKLSGPLKKKTKITIQATKKGYRKLVKVYKMK